MALAPAAEILMADLSHKQTEEQGQLHGASPAGSSPMATALTACKNENTEKLGL